jgi:hypothetical protein
MTYTKPDDQHKTGKQPPKPNPHQARDTRVITSGILPTE